MSEEFKVGDRVRMKQDIYEYADDYSPGGYYCHKDDEVTIRRVKPGSPLYKYSVQHDGRKPNELFGVNADEIEMLTPPSGNNKE